MKVFNDGLPKLIYNFLTTEFYDHDASRNTISATTLLKPTKEILLCQRHDDEIVLPASGRIWSLFGSGVHAALEKMHTDKHIEQEERLYTKVNGMLISGKFDVVMDNELNDYKVTSVWTVVYGSRKAEWIKQMSIYRYLYYKSKKIELKPTANIITILRDWASRDLLRCKNYPKAPIVEVHLDLMSFEETEKMIVDKTTEIKASMDIPDDGLPPCTDEERWLNKKKKIYNKCSKYCSCFEFCTQGKEGETNGYK